MTGTENGEGDEEVVEEDGEGPPEPESEVKEQPPPAQVQTGEGCLIT